MKINEIITEKWSEKYKRSINCKNPKGFSQRAHCQGRKKKGVTEERSSGYKEIEFICVNPKYPDATDPKLQKQMYLGLKKIPNVIPLLQDWDEYSEGQKSLSAIYKNKESKQKILALAKQLGVEIDLEQSVSDEYVDRAIRGEHEGQQSVMESVRAYHGNQGGIDTEQLHAPMWFTSDRIDAELYAGDDGYVVVADLNIKNPYIIEPKREETNKVLRRWQELQAQGFDGIHDRDSGDWIPFTRKQIQVISKDDVTHEGQST